MPILVDGNNLAHRLGVDRDEVRRLTLELARREQLRVVLVFDGPPPDGRPEHEALGRVTVVFAGNRSADDVIAARLPAQGQAKGWVVVTDDRDLGIRAKHAGARTRRLAEWVRKLADEPVSEKPDGLSADEVADWERYFSSR